MPAPKERILVVESDPAIGMMLTRQTLVPSGYEVRLAADASDAIQQALDFQPEAVIANLSLPGLSGKDLLVALSSQGVDAPVIVIAAHGQENSIIQAFRLGASDYLVWPFQDTEVTAVLERALEQVRSRRRKDKMTGQLRGANEELQRRLQDMNSLNLICKAILAETEPQGLFERLVEAGLVAGEANCGWLQVREELSKPFILAAQHGLPPRFAARRNQTWEDGISATCAQLGEGLSLSGEALQRFLTADLALAALATPLKIKNETLAVLVITRSANQPFSHSQQNLLKNIAEYAALAIGNARHVQRLESSTRTLQAASEQARLGEQIKDQLLSRTVQATLPLLQDTNQRLADFARAQTGKLGKTQAQNLRAIYNNLQAMAQYQALPEAGESGATAVSLNELVDSILGRFHILARQRGIALTAELPPAPLYAAVSRQELYLALQGLLAYALEISPSGRSVTLSVEPEELKITHIKINASPVSLPDGELEQLFKPLPEQPAPGGKGAVDLPLTARICENQGWQLQAIGDQGLTFHLRLPYQT